MTHDDGPDVAVLPSPPEDNLPTSPPPPSPGGPSLCLLAAARDGFAGGVMGSVFGFGQGLWKKQGFKGSLKEAGSSAKTFALLSGVHTLVTCFLTKIRGKHDEVNAGIAGCATGIALSIPGSPDAVLRSCVTFAAFSYIVERFNKPQAAIASPYDHLTFIEKQRFPEKGYSFSVLPPFVLAPTYLESLEASKRTNAEKYMPSKF